MYGDYNIGLKGRIEIFMMNETIPLFDEYWQYDKPAETAVKFRTLLPQLKAANDPSATLQLLTQLARTQSLQHHFEEAHTLLDEVKAALTSDLPIVHIRYLLERGRTFNSNHEQAKARPLFTKAYEKSVMEEQTFYAVDAAHMMGIAGETADERLMWNRHALELAEESPHPQTRRWIGSLTNNIGWGYFDHGSYEEALGLFERGVRFFENEGNEKRGRIARWAVARTYRALGQPKKALLLQQALHEEHHALQQQDGYVHEEIAECLLAIGKPTEATPHFSAAYALLSQDGWLRQNEPERLERLRSLGLSDEIA